MAPRSAPLTRCIWTTRPAYPSGRPYVPDCSPGTPSCPLEPSELVDGTLHVPFDRALIKDAPDFGVGRHLSPEQELQLYHHYGLDVAAPPTVPDHDFGKLAGSEET